MSDNPKNNITADSKFWSCIRGWLFTGELKIKPRIVAENNIYTANFMIHSVSISDSAAESLQPVRGW